MPSHVNFPRLRRAPKKSPLLPGARPGISALHSPGILVHFVVCRSPGLRPFCVARFKFSPGRPALSHSRNSQPSPQPNNMRVHGTEIRCLQYFECRRGGSGSGPPHSYSPRPAPLSRGVSPGTEPIAPSARLPTGPWWTKVLTTHTHGRPRQGDLAPAAQPSC